MTPYQPIMTVRLSRRVLCNLSRVTNTRRVSVINSGTALTEVRSNFQHYRALEARVSRVRQHSEAHAEIGSRIGLLSLINQPRARSHAAVDDCDDEDTTTGSVSSDSGRWNHSEGAVVRGTSGRAHVTVLGRVSKRRGHHDAATAGGKSAPASFRSRDAADTDAATSAGQSGSAAAASGPGARTVANGLKMAQTQAIAVAGFLADVDSRQWRVYASCFSHRASYHGRGD